MGKGQSALESPAAIKSPSGDSSPTPLAITRRQHGQSALEFLSTYGWALLIVLAIIATLYFFGVFSVSRYVPRSCTTQPGLPCDSYRMGLNESAPAQLSFKLLTHNGLGYDINVTNVTIYAEGLGVAGRKNYSGSCTSPSTGSSLSTAGTLILCDVPIGDTARIPRIGDSVRFTFSITYRNCETDPAYADAGSCTAGQPHTIFGNLNTQLEYESEITIPTPTPIPLGTPTPTPAPTPVPTPTPPPPCPSCGDEICDPLWESDCNCPADCPGAGDCLMLPPTCGNGVCEKLLDPPERYDNGTGITWCPEDCAPGCVTPTPAPTPEQCDSGCACYQAGATCYVSTQYDTACTDKIPACEYAAGQPGICCKDCADDPGCACVPTGGAGCAAVGQQDCSWNPTTAPCYLADNTKNCCKPVPTPTPIPISSCGFVISSPGNYAVTGPLTYNGVDPCIDVARSGITLDCQNNMINGVGAGSGITIDASGGAVTGVTVKNCRISNFMSGIYIYLAESNTLQNNTITSSGNDGIGVTGGNGNTITSNTISGSAYWDIECDHTATRSGNTCSTVNKNCLGCGVNCGPTICN